MDVAVLEPLEVLRCGLEAMLRRLEFIGNLECHRSMEELLIAAKGGEGEWNPDVIVVSCCSPSDIADRVRAEFPESRILELLACADSKHLAMAAKTRADGYLMLHDITGATLDGTLRSVACGELPMSPPIVNYLLDRARSGEISPLPSQCYFSPREHGVIALLLEGLSNREIADKLGISLHSAKRHVSAILSKVNSPSRAHFVAQMLRGE